VAQSGFTPIQLFRSATAAAVPTGASLVAGELAINTADERLFFTNSGGTVQLLASSAAAAGSFVTVAATTSVTTPLVTNAGTLALTATGANIVSVATNGAERMRVTAAGRVGIGTVAPSTTFNVVSTDEFSAGFTVTTTSTQTALFNHPVALIGNSSTAAANGVGLRFTLADTAGGGQIAAGIGAVATSKTASTVASDLYFYTGTNERMRVLSNGYVGIGASAPNGQLVVNGVGGNGTIAGGRNALYLRNANSTGAQSSAIIFGSAGTESSCQILNDISANGTTINRLDIFAGSGGGVFLATNATSWSASSDERMKTIIEPIANASAKVSTLRAVIGRYHTDALDKRRAFLIAQDVLKVLPEAVNVPDDPEAMMGVAYAELVPLLVAALTEQAAKIDALVARVTQLESAQ